VDNSPSLRWTTSATLVRFFSIIPGDCRWIFRAPNTAIIQSVLLQKDAVVEYPRVHSVAFQGAIAEGVLEKEVQGKTGL